MSAASMALPVFTLDTWTATHSGPFVSRRRGETECQDNPINSLPLSISRLVSLLDENGEDDYGKIGPSQLAFKNALRLVVEATMLLGKDVPSSPVVDSQGGIRITWRRDDKQIKLVCPATRDTPVYIYHASASGNSLRNQNITSAVLADRLAWLIHSESTVSEQPAY